MPDGKTTLGDIVRKRIFDTQRPDYYPYGSFLDQAGQLAERGKNFIIGKTRAEQNKEDGSVPVDKFSDAGFSKYLNQKNDIVRESRHRPSGAKEGERYYTFEDAKSGEGIRKDLETFLKSERDTGEKLKYPFNTSDASLTDTGFALGHFTINKGEDEGGSFIDVSDRYDFDINNKNVKKFVNKSSADNISGGKGFNVYDKLYYDPETLEILEGGNNNKNLASAQQSQSKPWGL